MQTLFQTYNRLVERINYANQRYLYDRIDWNERLIGIKGARGVGAESTSECNITKYF